jgi:methionine aminopeptidase
VIEDQTSRLYNKKVDGMAVEKGVAFPVCISVNEVICNHSPLPSEELVSVIKEARILFEPGLAAPSLPRLQAIPSAPSCD